MATHTFRKIVVESLPILAVVLIIALITGQLLDSQLVQLLPVFSFILLIIPAFIDITGDLAGVVGARVTSHLYTGELDEHFRPYPLLTANLIGIILVSTTAYAFLALCVIGITHFMFHILPFHLIIPFFIAILGAGVSATASTSFFGLFAARLVYQSGRDPDSIIPPLTTTIGDLLGILFITYALLAVAMLA